MKTKILIAIISLFSLYTQVNAQKTTSPTLEQTMSFISLKCMDISWRQAKGNVEKGTSLDYKVAVWPNDKIYLKDNTLYVVSKESEISNQEELLISLNLVEGLSLLEKDNAIRLYSSKPFFIINSRFKNDRPLYDDKNIYLKVREEDAQKVYKAFKHLLELLNVKLNDDMF